MGDDMIAARGAGMYAIGHVPSYLPETHADLLARGGLYSELYRTQFAQQETAPPAGNGHLPSLVSE